MSKLIISSKICIHVLHNTSFQEPPKPDYSYSYEILYHGPKRTEEIHQPSGISYQYHKSKNCDISKGCFVNKTEKKYIIYIILHSVKPNNTLCSNAVCQFQNSARVLNLFL